MKVRRAVLPALLLATLASERVGAVPCPGNGAKLRIVINNPTATTGHKVFISGSVVDGQATCAGQADTYATTFTLSQTGDNTFTIPVAGGLNSGVWMHHISAGDQFQHQRSPIMFTTDSSKYATIRWTYYPTVFQVNKAGDASGSCTASVCTFRQALTAANAVLGSSTAVLVQLMLSPGGMTQSGDILIGAVGSSTILTIDGTDANGNPWIVGDPLAAAQGNQSPFFRIIDLGNTTKLLIGGNNVTVRGLAIVNTVTSGSPTKTLIESTGTNTRIESVRLNGGATGTCSGCVTAGLSLMQLTGGLAQVANVEGFASYSHGASVSFGAGTSEIRDSWFHHNYASGVRFDGVLLERNTVELTGRRATNNTVVNTDGVGVRPQQASEIGTVGNVVQNNTSFGIEAYTAAPVDFAHDAVCGNGDVGMAVEVSSSSIQVGGTGLSTIYNESHGVEFSGPSTNVNAIQFNDDSAFVSNAFCGFSNETSFVTASAVGNQWRGAVTSCAQSSDRCTGGSQGPITCDPFQSHTNAAIVLDSLQPTYPRNVFLKGQTIRVQGEGFNAIDGNPDAGDADCQGGDDVVTSENCCRDKAKANVCASTGTPPNPPTDGSNCVSILDGTGVWSRLAVSSVTPTTIVTEVPNPGLLCIGEGYAQTVRVIKQGSMSPIEHSADYCRNLP